MQSRYTKSVVEGNRHYWVDFIFKQNGVAHHHRAAFCFSERGPGAESHEGRHRPTSHGDFHVIARKGDFVDTFRLVHFPLEPSELVDLCRVESRVDADAGGSKNCRCD